MSNDNLIPMFKDQCEVSQATSVINAFDIYLDEEIKDPTYYRQALQVIRAGQRGDLVRIHISSPGGNLNSALMFKNAIEESEADVLAIIQAEAYSAAGLIALSCPMIEVKKHATMMCHSAAFGAGGIVQNVRDHVDFTGKHAEAVMDEVYENFLNSEELEDIRRGREIWLDYIQISERLDTMFEARNAKGCGVEGCTECGPQGDDLEDIEEFDLEELSAQKVQEALSAARPEKKASRPQKAPKVVEKSE